MIKSNWVRILQLLTLLAVAGAPTSTYSQSESMLLDTDRQYIIGTKRSPPFAFKTDSGRWTGISIDLWRQLAEELDLKYEFREMTLAEMFDGLENDEIDAAVAAISVTAERYERIEFCHPHFTTGLGIAVAEKRRGNIWVLVQRVLSARLLKMIGVMFGIVACCGLLFWLVERRKNEALFGGKRRQGIGMGIWWSTILLLGHKGIMPVTISGRVLAFSAMLASIVLLSTLTGVIASVLTIQQLEIGISGPGDLSHIRVVTVESSTSEEYLRRRRVSHQIRPNALAAVAAVENGEADAVVYDEAMLQYLANTEFAGSIQVLPVSFHTQEYAIALQPSSSLRLPLNEALLRFRASDDWDELVFRYLGESPANR